MIFQQGKIPYEDLFEYRYYGRAKDKKGKTWTWTTNSYTGFEHFRKTKQFKDLTYIEGYENHLFFVIKRLEG